MFTHGKLRTKHIGGRGGKDTQQSVKVKESDFFSITSKIKQIFYFNTLKITIVNIIESKREAK